MTNQPSVGLAHSVLMRTRWLQRALSLWARRTARPGVGPARASLALTEAGTRNLVSRVQRLAAGERAAFAPEAAVQGAAAVELPLYTGVAPAPASQPTPARDIFSIDLSKFPPLKRDSATPTPAASKPAPTVSAEAPTIARPSAPRPTATTSTTRTVRRFTRIEEITPPPPPVEGSIPAGASPAEPDTESPIARPEAEAEALEAPTAPRPLEPPGPAPRDGIDAAPAAESSEWQAPLPELSADAFLTSDQV